MRTITVRKGLIVFACGLALGQTAERQLTFDAASVKPASPTVGVPGAKTAQPKQPGGRRVPERPSGGTGTTDPGRIHYPAVTLQLLLIDA